MIRTQGDGVENPEIVPESRRRSVKSTSSAEDTEKVDKLGKKLFLSKKYQSSSSSSFYNPHQSHVAVTNFPPEIKPNGKKFFLIPKLIAPRKSAALPLKPKIPKLIIMEPYKACITPMIPYPSSNNKVRKPPKINKNNLELNELVRHMKITKISCENHPSSSASIDGDEITQLRKERDQFESQLRFQMQVNSELKQLLLSAIGDEDSSKLSSMAEDKMKIAEHLSSNTEKIEFLAGQSEVWRSKFLASSLMVEELAKWKAALSEKNTQLISSNKRLLETIATVRDMEVELYSNLKFLSNYQETNLKSSNVIDITSECLNISQQLVLNSGKIGMPERLTTNLDPMTTAQKQALLVMDNSSDFLTATDDASKAICNQATQEYQRVRTHSETFEFVDSRDAK